jgi:hypothetical protein
MRRAAMLRRIMYSLASLAALAIAVGAGWKPSN